MNATAARMLRVPLSLAFVWAVLAAALPQAMAHYRAFVIRPGIACAQGALQLGTSGDVPAGACRGLADLYGIPAADLLTDAAFRSIALLAGATAIALVFGVPVGMAIALWRRHALAGGAMAALTAALAAVPAFFAGYFLQMIVIFLGGLRGSRILPVYGFGYDGHLVLPLLAISLPALAYTAQLTATRMSEVLDSDFVITANAKGLRTRAIVLRHVLPHVRPVILEGLGSGLRVSVASLPIVEFLFQWRGIGQLALEAVGVKDVGALIFCALVLASLFAGLSLAADLSRPRALGTD